ncbi:nucleotide-binding universal stress UspA family protein [Aquimarina sp. EL_43]|uniref:universal stress protein n=1 Tax=unclassified Aquimarina TaxID=2627091 RepID=UPI001A26023A|nr:MULTISPECIES: universal stress protein [unclassified Aquimarina]MBG6133087.1 nucleotide-binding universal stress UspA family protein [Aquimarina sp. EL_35]MBG6153245.1 nucleotide-binding universal stress UspA family protein [Aquimarina sp. EL_32]MBG6171486.1 nucleotide-binding universal stress UspA family protein [Aquimarina sp. EL_43]
MNELPNHKFNTILIGVAFSPNLKNNIFEAMRMVDFFDSKMIIVHVGEKTNEKENNIKKLISGFSDDDDEKVNVIWKQGDPVTVIIETARENNADLIMLGAIPREDFLKFYIGSIARKITRNAHCSVLLLIKPSEDLRPCNHIVVNGLKDEKTRQTILDSFEVAQNLGAQKLTIVEEISRQEVKVIVEDDQSLLKDTLIKEQLAQKEDLRVQHILSDVPEDLKTGILIKTQSIFGKRGYSIGHYAKVVAADLLIMNAPKRTTFLDRIFLHDLEHILSELPTDVLIMR